MKLKNDFIRDQSKKNKDNIKDNGIKYIKNKKLILIISIIVLAVIFMTIILNNEIKKDIMRVFNEKIQNADENTQVEVFDDGSIILTDDSAIISSASVVNRITGTGPFDENDEPGNDSSPDNDIIRSFDTLTWEIEASLAINNEEYGSQDASKYTSFRGGIINVEATLPSEYAGTMKWSLEDMTWAIGTGIVSENGLTFTAQYKMPEDKITVPGKQTISLVLKVEGAGNETRIKPNIKLWMQGNETNSQEPGYEAKEITDQKGQVKVSAKPGFNIKLVPNTFYQPKTTVDFNDGNGDISGRIYGYGVLLQLYNENKEKGLKGLEYPKGDITFDIETKLEAIEKIDGKQQTTDITSLATPKLWNYKVNIGYGSQNPAYGNIPDRNMYFGMNTGYVSIMPYGMQRDLRPEGAIYNSGNILMIQEDNKIKTTINEFKINGIFPKYNDSYNESTSIVYGENIGCFSAGYFQIFVPDNEETTKTNRTYYLTVEDKNININTTSNQQTTDQVITTDDSSRVQHYISKPGTYSHYIYIYEENGKDLNGNGAMMQKGKGRKAKNQVVQVRAYIYQYGSNDVGTEIKSVNRLVKFDGDGLEPILQENGEKAEFVTDTMTWKSWYVTKKDGTNWKNEEERNNSGIEDLNIYENIQDIPEGYICIGMYFESQGGSMSRESKYIQIKFKIKDTAEIGKTYGIMQDSDYWTETLDRTTQTIKNPDAEYPKPVWSRRFPYQKTQYDENGQIVAGTHQNYIYGNTILVVGADSKITVKTINPDNEEEKTVYDIGKNENIVTLKIEPALSEIDSQIPTNIKGVTVRIKETLPEKLTYLPESSNYGEPLEVIKNQDGTTTYIWEIYNCNVGEEIEPLILKAQIDPDVENGTTLQTTSVIEPDKEIIGLSSLDVRTSTTGIQIVNLSSHSLYKETETKAIENNGEIKYKITYENKTDITTPDFQLIDILPYNGDGRGTTYIGEYTLENVKVTQEGKNGLIDTSNLKLYTTTDTEARKITPKDENIGVADIWEEKQIGKTISEPVTVVALKGEIPANTRVEMEITLKTNNNSPKDKYVNSVTAQTSKETEVITSSNVEISVVKRQIEGMIWYDTNENGIKDENEQYANKIEVELTKVDGSKAEDINGNEIQNILTNEQGKYVFTNLQIGEYIVKIKTEDKYKLTTANVGSNKEINSKFEEVGEEKKSYIITNLNNLQSPDLKEMNVNAGLVVKDAKIIVKYLEEDNTPQTDEDNKKLKDQKEIIYYEKDGINKKYKIGDNYEVTAENIDNYITLRNSGNTSGVLDAEEVVVTYYYTYNKKDITVEKIWEDNNNKEGKRPNTVTIQIKKGRNLVEEAEVSNKENWKHTFKGLQKYDSNGQEINYTIDEGELQGEAQMYYTKEIEGTTIKNKMTKHPGTVTVKYIDKKTKEEISEKVEKEGIIGENYDVTEDKKEVPGYTLIEEPEEKIGTYTEEAQEKIYYYAKNTEVIVKYLEKDNTPEDNSDNKVIEKEVKIEGYEGKKYQSEQKEIKGYTFIGSTENTEGEMKREKIEVIYYYAQNTKVIVKHMEQDNTPEDDSDNKILETEKIEGYEGKKYKTEQKEIEGYTFVGSSENTEGIMKKEEIEVIYYYAKNTKVTVKYLEKDNTQDDNTDNKVLFTEIIINGYEGKKYKTEQKEIKGYTFVGSTENTEGTMTKEEIEVIYYYAQNTKVIVQHIDKQTGEILIEEIKEGKVGDICKTQEQNIDEYILVEKPENDIIEMTKEEQIIKYFYAHISKGVIEKHIDINSGEILEEENHTGKEGDKYKIDAKEFEGYDLVTSKLPENAEGEMKKELIEVKYYYIKRAKVIVQYLEQGTERKLSEEKIINGHENEKYKTEAKDIKGYSLIKIPNNAEGKMEITIKEDGSYNTETIVKYYYIKKAGGVIEKHIDINNGKILNEEEHKGNVGDKYEINPKEFEGYYLLKEDENGNSKLPQNAIGEMTEEKIEVIYYYKKLSTVKVEYVDKATGEKLKEEKLEGYIGEIYQTEKKDIEGYVLVETPENEKGKFTQEDIIVTYYYQRRTEVEVKYLDKQTGYEIAEIEKIEGYLGTKYETKAKDIQYYKLIDQTENTEGEMTKEKIQVVYYYEKQIFNLRIDKWIKEVNINGVTKVGQTYETKEQLYKIDIHRNEILTSKVKVIYKIRVTNIGEIEGTANKITELIPEGMSYIAEDNKVNWKEENGTLVTDELKEEIIEPGESKEIEIVLRWNNGEENFREKKNTVMISGTENPAKYVDINKEDNISKSEIIISIATGKENRNRELIIILGIQIIVLIIVVNIIYKRRKNN